LSTENRGVMRTIPKKWHIFLCMFAGSRPTVQVPEGIQWPPDGATKVPRLPPTQELSNDVVVAIVTSAVDHLGERLKGMRFSVSPVVAMGTTRCVLTVSALDTNESFVVKVSKQEILSYGRVVEHAPSSSFRENWVKKYVALEEAIAWDGLRRVTVAPCVKGETLLAHATQRGLEERNWRNVPEFISTIMKAIWTHSRAPHDPGLGLLLDHHFDNIIFGVKQPPFHDEPADAKQRLVFVDRRDDGEYHPQETLEDAIEDFRALFKQHAIMRTPWG
jgi:hypothetical protein